MFRPFVRFVSVLSILALTSCAAPRQFGEIQSFDAERKLGEETLPEFLTGRGGLYTDEQLTRYLAQITARLAATVDVPEEYRPLRVRVLDTNDPSAFALPGGAMFLSRGIIALAKDEAQLAGVIAHEMTHVIRRHSAKRIAANERQILDIVREQDQSLRGAPRSRQIAIFERELEARIGVISQFSQEQELEADRVGLQMVAAAGYDPSGFGDLLERIEAYDLRRFSRRGVDEEQFKEVAENSGYPQLAERVTALGTFPKVEVDTAGRDRLMNVIDGIKFDDLYQGGLVRDGVYWHPTQRVAFDIPQGVLPSHSSSFRMLSQHGRIDVRIENSDDVSLDSLAESLNASETESIELTRTTINGFPAVTGKSKFNRLSDEFRSELAIMDLEGRFAIFGLLTKPKDEASIRPVFMQILNSVRTTKFGAAPKRRRYQTRRIQNGDTAASLLEESAFGTDGEGDFRLLNGLDAGQIPPVGNWIKLVD